MSFCPAYFVCFLSTTTLYFSPPFSIALPSPYWKFYWQKEIEGGRGRKGGEGENGFCGKIELELIEGRGKGLLSAAIDPRGPPEEEGQKSLTPVAARASAPLPFLSLRCRHFREGRKEGSSEDDLLTAERGEKIPHGGGGKGTVRLRSNEMKKYQSDCACLNAILSTFESKMLVGKAGMFVESLPPTSLFPHSLFIGSSGGSEKEDPIAAETGGGGGHNLVCGRRFMVVEGRGELPNLLPSIPPPRLHSKFGASRVPSWRPYCGVGVGRRTALAKEGASIPFPYLQTRRSSLTSPVLFMCLGKGETCEQRSGYAAHVS